MDRRTDRVVPLERLRDFDVAEGDPDVRGWDVIAGDRRRIGEVGELLIDTDAMKVRYLDVVLDEEAVAETEPGDRHILIPIGYARLREDEDQVIVPELDSERLRSIPPYEDESLTREYETALRRHLGDGPADRAPDGSSMEGAMDRAGAGFGSGALGSSS